MRGVWGGLSDARCAQFASRQINYILLAVRITRLLNTASERRTKKLLNIRTWISKQSVVFHFGKRANVSSFGTEYLPCEQRSSAPTSNVHDIWVHSPLSLSDNTQGKDQFQFSYPLSDPPKESQTVGRIPSGQVRHRMCILTHFWDWVNWH